MNKKLRASSKEGPENKTDTYTIESDKHLSALQKTLCLRDTAGGIRGAYFETLKILRGIKERSNNEPFAVFDDLYSLLWREDFIFQAINKLKINKGTSTPRHNELMFGVDQITFDQYNNDKALAIIEKLKTRTYHFLPVKRIMILKPGKKVKRQIPSFEDRIVQEMIRTILEQIYEPVFDRTHGTGFRPRRGCHESVHRLTQQVKGMEWCIEGDIKHAYDNIQHSKLISILSEKIKDTVFLKLIRNGLECGFKLQGKLEHSLLGTPQEGIASPILFNIYMSKLDEYVANDLSKEIQDKNQAENLPSVQAVTKSYDKIKNEISRIQQKEKKGELQLESKERLKFLELNKFNVPYLDKKRATIRLVYARYADDWLLFTNGSEKFAIQLRDKISNFLIQQLGLELSLEKTKVTNIITSRVKFLGYSLSTFDRKIKKVTEKSTESPAKRIRVNLVAGIDQDKLDSRLMQKGFITKDGMGGIKPRRKEEWTVLQDHEIIRKYNYVIRGLSNYYILINQVSHINWYGYLLYYSCAHTLANKHNTSIRKIFEKYGHPIKTDDLEKVKGKKGEKAQNLEANKIKLLDYNQIKEIINKQKTEFKKRLESKKSDNKSIDTDKNDPLDLKANWRTTYRLAEHYCVCG